MADAWHVYQGCGSASWLVMFAAVVATPFSMVAFAVALARWRAARIVAGLAFVVSLLPLGVGAVGVTLARAKVDAVLDSGAVDAAFHERIRAEGYREADGCLVVGFGGSALPVAASLLTLGLVFVRPPRSAA